MQEDIECVFESMTSRGSIYISNLPAAQNVELLHSKGIRAILSVARSGLVKHKKQDIPHYLFIPAEDHKDYELIQHFEDTFQFIEKSRKETNVLVHCMAGVSRSVTIVIAYLLKKYKYTLENVLSMIFRKRRKINPNKGFIEQLKKYAESEGIKCEMRGDYLEVLRGRSATRNKRGVSQDLVKRTITMNLKEHKHINEIKVVKNEFKQQYLEEVPEPMLPIRKITSFDESKERQIQNEQCQAQSTQKLNETKATLGIQRKQVATKERGGLSIQEKIKRVRDKILKREQNGRQVMKSSGQHSPIYKRSPKKLEESSLENLNRGRTQLQVIKPIPVDCKQKPQKEAYRPAKILVNRSGSSLNRSQSAQKDIFSQELKIQLSTLYSPMRAPKRCNRLQ